MSMARERRRLNSLPILMPGEFPSKPTWYLRSQAMRKCWEDTGYNLLEEGRVGIVAALGEENTKQVMQGCLREVDKRCIFSEYK